MTTDSFTLSTEQLDCFNKAVEFIDHGKPDSLLRIGGWGGTGKTTILSRICSQYKTIAPCAYTGKAADVLRQKGVNATTIHKQIYVWDDVKQRFHHRNANAASAFLIDEASMIGAEMFADLQTFGKPILAIGDPGQLPPISKYDLNLMEEPDLLLNTIHRQALENPILDFATQIRTQSFPFQYESETCNVIHGNCFDDILWADITLCGTNATRVVMNREIRSQIGFKDLIEPTDGLGTPDVIEENEQIICLKNDSRLGVFNGQLFTVIEIVEEGFQSVLCLIEDELGDQRYLNISTIAFGRKKSPKFNETRDFFGKAMIADYGYCITVHKAQGSEWGKVTVLREETELWDQRRWDYTAATRAAKELRYYV